MNESRRAFTQRLWLGAASASARHARIDEGPAVAAAEFLVGRLLVAAVPLVLLLYPFRLGGVPLLLGPFRDVFRGGSHLVFRRLTGRLLDGRGRRQGHSGGHGARDRYRHERDSDLRHGVILRMFLWRTRRSTIRQRNWFPRANGSPRAILEPSPSGRVAAACGYTGSLRATAWIIATMRGRR